MGGRTLRVDFAENEKGTVATGGPGTSNAPEKSPPGPGGDWWGNQGPIGGGGGGGRGGPPILPIRPEVQPFSQNNNFPNPQPAAAIPQVIQDMSQPALHDLLSKMKQLAQNNPDTARQALISNPQLAISLLHAQIVMGMIGPNVVQRIVAHATAKQQAATLPVAPGFAVNQAPVQNQFNPQMGQMGPMGMGMGNNNMGGMGNNMGNNMGAGNMGNSNAGMNMGIGMMSGNMMQNKIPPAQMGGGVGFGGGAPASDAMQQQHTLLAQVINLTPAQIEQLPPPQRQQVIQLKQLYLQQQPSFNPNQR